MIATYNFEGLSIHELESLYQLWKTSYYTGKQLVSDEIFDACENLLKGLGSTLPNIVGYKLSDADFTHPSRMRSLLKIQMSETSNMFDEFCSWYNKRVSIIGEKPKLQASPKFDGNSVNIIVTNRKVVNAVTRGDGDKGKTVYDKIGKQIDDVIAKLNIDEDNYEVRCEIVINKNLFSEKYGETYANARNYVAGVLRKDDFDAMKCAELTVLPLQVVVEGHTADDCNILGSCDFNNPLNESEYENIIEHYISYRESCDYLLDGIVFTFPAEYRSLLGENMHDPEWGVAIKYVPDTAIATVRSIVWQIGTTGEFTPVVSITPVELAGTIVTKASGYNYDYIKNNKITEGAKLKIHKAGEIIPEIACVVSTPETLNLIYPDVCPYCNNKTVIEAGPTGVLHLCCVNVNCRGIVAKKLCDMSKILKIKGIGPATVEKFATEANSSISLLYLLKTKFLYNDMQFFKHFGFDTASKSFYNFADAIRNFKEIQSHQIIQCYNVNGIGESLSKELAKFYDANDANFFGHEKKLVELYTSEKCINEYNDFVYLLESVDIKVIKYTKPADDVIWVEMTGSPKEFGFKSKGEWVKQFDGKVMMCGLSDSKCMYLVTDDTSKMSAKMKNAVKKGIKIITYDHKF